MYATIPSLDHSRERAIMKAIVVVFLYTFSPKVLISKTPPCFIVFNDFGDFMLTSEYHVPDNEAMTGEEKIRLYSEKKKIVENSIKGIDKVKKAYYDGCVRYDNLFRIASSLADQKEGDYGNKSIIFSYLLIWNDNRNNYTVSLSMLKPNSAVSNMLMDVDEFQSLNNNTVFFGN